MDEIRKAKRAGNVRLVRQLREGTVTAVVETPDHPKTLEASEMDAGVPTDETPTHPEHQE